MGQHGVIEGFHCRDNEQTAVLRQFREQTGMDHQVFHLGGEIEGQVREPAVQLATHPQGMGGSIEEVRVSEGDMAGAGGHHGGDILQNRGQRHCHEVATIDGGQRTVAADMKAATAGLHRRRRRPARSLA